MLALRYLTGSAVLLVLWEAGSLLLGSIHFSLTDKFHLFLAHKLSFPMVLPSFHFCVYFVAIGAFIYNSVFTPLLFIVHPFLTSRT